MAERALEYEPIDYTIGTMEISEQKATFNVFINLVKWASLVITALMLFLTVWFGAEAGFIPAFISAVVVLVGGVWFLRAKNASDRPH
jgi:Bacterial aa3 type cytochrome c oxidase subunit IV